MITVLIGLGLAAALLAPPVIAVAAAYLAQAVADALADDPELEAEIDASDVVDFHPGLGRWIVRVCPSFGVFGPDIRSRTRAAELAGACPDDLTWKPAFRVWIVGDRPPLGTEEPVR